MNELDEGRPDGFRLVPLTEDLAAARVSELIDFDRDTPGERWTEVHWLYTLPDKWRLSWVVAAPNGELQAYLVASRHEGPVMHVHRMTARESARGRGLGTMLMGRAARTALADGLTEMTGKIRADNLGSQRLLARLGFRTVGSERGNVLLAASCAEIVAGALRYIQERAESRTKDAGARAKAT